MSTVSDTLKQLIRQHFRALREEEEKNSVILDTEEDVEASEEVQSEFSSAGGTGAIGSFGWAVPLGGKSNAKSVEKKSKKKNK